MSQLSQKKIAIQRVLEEFIVNAKKFNQISLVLIGWDLVQNTIKINCSDNEIVLKEKLF